MGKNIKLIEIKKSLHKELKIYCVINNVKMRTFVNDAVENFLKELKKNAKENE